MANGFDVSIALSGSVLAKWTTRRKYVTLAEAQRHVPNDFERGSYKITFRDEDSRKHQRLGTRNQV